MRDWSDQRAVRPDILHPSGGVPRSFGDCGCTFQRCFLHQMVHSVGAHSLRGTWSMYPRGQHSSVLKLEVGEWVPVPPHVSGWCCWCVTMQWPCYTSRKKVRPAHLNSPGSKSGFPGTATESNLPSASASSRSVHCTDWYFLMVGETMMEWATNK